jgi:hypothetical protein
MCRCAHTHPNPCLHAQMAELVDALVSGTSVGNNVQVRVLFWAQAKLQIPLIYWNSGVLCYAPSDPGDLHPVLQELKPTGYAACFRCSTLTSSTPLTKWIPQPLRLWALLPRGFLQVSASDRQRGSIHRPAPPARRLTCSL